MSDDRPTCENPGCERKASFIFKKWPEDWDRLFCAPCYNAWDRGARSNYIGTSVPSPKPVGGQPGRELATDGGHLPSDIRERPHTECPETGELVPLEPDGGSERPESGKCPNCGTVSDRAYESVAPEFTEFDCRNENCRCEVFRVIHGKSSYRERNGGGAE